MKIGSQVYVKGSVEAVECYQKAFGLTLGFHVRNEDNSFAHASLMLGKAEFLALSERQDRADINEIFKCPERHHPTMQFSVCDLGEDGVRKAYEILKVNAVFLKPLEPCPWNDLCAGLMDKYGVFWWISK